MRSHLEPLENHHNYHQVKLFCGLNNWTNEVGGILINFGQGAEVFFRHPGQVMTRQQLLDLVWGYDYDPGSNIVDIYVGYLRKKLGDESIETIMGKSARKNLLPMQPGDVISTYADVQELIAQSN